MGVQIDLRPQIRAMSKSHVKRTEPRQVSGGFSNKERPTSPPVQPHQPPNPAPPPPLPPLLPPRPPSFFPNPCLQAKPPPHGEEKLYLYKEKILDFLYAGFAADVSPMSPSIVVQSLPQNPLPTKVEAFAAALGKNILEQNTA